MARILLVDDDPDTIAVVGLFLRTAGHDVTTAMDGETAWEQYQTTKTQGTPFDLIILDLAMPYINGFEVAQRIRDTGDEGSRIAFLSAHPREFLDRAHEFKPCGLWSKPVTFEVLTEQVDGCLSGC